MVLLQYNLTLASNNINGMIQSEFMGPFVFHLISVFPIIPFHISMRMCVRSGYHTVRDSYSTADGLPENN